MRKFLSLLSLLFATMMSWTNTFAQTGAEYESALAFIENGAAYYIKTDVSGTKYYLKIDGTLTSTKADAGVFKFRKTWGGPAFGYGFRIDSGKFRFSNPEGKNDEDLTKGRINTTTNDRVDWDAQVLFRNNKGRFAIRATNANGGSNAGTWEYVAGTFWTVHTGPVAEYSFSPYYIWELEKKYTANQVSQLEEVPAKMALWIPLIQKSYGLVKDASQYTSNAKDPEEGSYAALLDGDYETFFHTSWHSSNDPHTYHYLQAELNNQTQKFLFYYKKRSQNNNNRPMTIYISASNTGTNFSGDLESIETGLPTEESVTDYISDVIDLGTTYKYIRFTVTQTNNGDKLGNYVFFTFSEFYILPNTPAIANALAMLKADTPLYSIDLQQFNTVNASLGGVTVTYKLVDTDGSVISTKEVVQGPNSDVVVPDEWTSCDYYDYETTGTIGSSDCEIIVSRTFKQGLVLSLSDLTNTKAYIISCDRGKFLTKNGHMVSTANKSYTYAEPSTFAILNYDGNYYLYSVADGKFVTNTGALADVPTNGDSDAIVMDATTAPYFYYSFNILFSGNLNTNGDDPYGYVINEWDTPDAGNQYYMIAVADFDPTDALAILEYYINPKYTVTYVIKDSKGNTLKTIEDIPVAKGTHITTLPVDYQNAFCSYSTADVTITEAHTNIEFTARWDKEKGVLTVVDDYDDIVWQNMYLDRGDKGHHYLARIDDAVTFVKDPTIEELRSDGFQWGFVGNAYQGIIIYNKTGGINNPVSCSNIDVWTDLVKSGDGILIGKDGRYLNQEGGENGTRLTLWNDLNDVGSIWYVSDVPGSQATTVYFDVVFNGEIVKTATAIGSIGSKIPAIPTTLDNGLVYLSRPSGTVTQENQHVQIKATAKTPFAFMTDLDHAVWYNMTIRGNWFVFVDSDWPHVPVQNPSDEERASSRFLWAFGGNPYSIIVYNKAYVNDNCTFGISDDIAPNIVGGVYAWDALACDDGFILKVSGSNNNCINQYGGPGGPLRLWNNTAALTDEGCILRVCKPLSDGVDSVPVASEGDAIYNVAGQRLSKMQKGIYIVGGKKILK